MIFFRFCFEIFGKFVGNFLGIVWEAFFGRNLFVVIFLEKFFERIFLEDFFGRIFLEGILFWEFFVKLVCQDFGFCQDFVSIKKEGGGRTRNLDP